MSFEIVGFTLDTVGKIMLGISVYLVHKRMIKEGRFDRAVISEIKKERILAVIGIILMILGFLLQLPAKVI